MILLHPIHNLTRILPSCPKLRGRRSAPETKALPLAPVLPVGPTRDPVVASFQTAIHECRTLAFFYQGGSTPGILRRFLPVSLYRLESGGPVYAVGRCALRNETRTIRLDRVRLG
ncbi:deoR family transcriptional regulator [Haloferula helveola]|uniref:DeoR family transcriptional regulator n=2 Tax=Haloferula helveola TaxID=490095 RepID=A0ABN6GZH4_9BACT|nr:deoR family transcriptional regulator [Haloferula helveola]